MGNSAPWFTKNIDQERVYRFDIGVYIFTLLYTVTFLSLTIKKLWCTLPEKAIYKSIRFMSTIHSVFYLTYFILFWPDTNVNNTEWNRIFSYVMLMLGQLSFYALMTLRLYQTFTATIYALSTTKIKIFTILICVVLVIWIVWFSQPIYVDQDTKSKQFRLFNSIVLCLILGLSCLYGFLLISLFVSKLFKLTLSQRRSIHIFNEKRITSSLSTSFGGANYVDLSKSKSNCKPAPIELNEKQKCLVSTMIKNSFLGITAIVLYQCLFLIGPIIIQDYRMEVMYKFVFALAIFFEMLCIYLSFKTNDNAYKCLCGKCHNCCENWCENVVENKMQKLQQQTLDLLDTSQILEEVSLTDTSLNNMSLNNNMFS